MASPEPFGPYTLVSRLAVGGMAELFLARRSGEAGFSKACVIKRILPHLAEDAEFVSMFLDEARLAARLNHPHLVQVFDFGRAGASYYLGMEYLAGEDLGVLLRRSREAALPVPVEVAVYLVARAAAALHYAHELRAEDGTPLRIVHRDISPSNIVATYQGAVKVLDFGIARAESRLQRSRAGQVKGKLTYMAPEQSRGEPVDRRADVWSLGICLFELLTGERPFHASTGGELAERIRSAPLPSVRSFRPELPEALDGILAAALERELTRRLATAEQLRARLEDFLVEGGYRPAEARLVEYLRVLFGEERAESRLRMAVLPPPTGPKTERLEPITDKVQDPTLNLGPPLNPAPPSPAPPPVDAPRPLPSRRRWPLALGAGLAGVLLAGGVWRALAPSFSEPEPSAVSGAPQPSPAPRASVLSPEPPAAPEPATPEPTPAEPPAATPAPTSQRLGSSPATRKARLSVESNLRARAWVDEKPVGALPLRGLELKPGTHRLRVHDPKSGASREVRLVLTAGQHHEERVVFGEGMINVLVEPWADVWLGERHLGQTPLAGVKLWEGTHRLRLVHPSGARQVSVQIQPGQTTVVRERLP